MRDDDGYYVLQRKENPTEQTKDKEPKKEKKAKLPKYKKGTWKHSLLKRLKKMFIPVAVEDFHFTRAENILVSFGKKRSVVLASKTAFQRSKIKSMLKDAEDTTVFIYASDDMYLRIPGKSYLKLCEIDRMIIDFSFCARMDYGEEIEIDHRTYSIAHIGDLADFIIQHRAGINGVYELEASCYGFEHPRYDIHAMVMKTDGEVETYKGDLNTFMDKYGLLPF